MELLLGSYSADLDEIETEIKIFIDMIEDTDQFISAHLDSVRNEIIKMSLFIEVGGFVFVFGRDDVFLFVCVKRASIRASSLKWADLYLYSIMMMFVCLCEKIIKMSLFIKVGGLIMGFGAVVSGIFGMNLKNHVEVKLLWRGITENKIFEVSSYQY